MRPWATGVSQTQILVSQTEIAVIQILISDEARLCMIYVDIYRHINIYWFEAICFSLPAMIAVIREMHTMIVLFGIQYFYSRD